MSAWSIVISSRGCVNTRVTLAQVCRKQLNGYHLIGLSEALRETALVNRHLSSISSSDWASFKPSHLSRALVIYLCLACNYSSIFFSSSIRRCFLRTIHKSSSIVFILAQRQISLYTAPGSIVFSPPPSLPLSPCSAFGFKVPSGSSLALPHFPTT